MHLFPETIASLSGPSEYFLVTLSPNFKIISIWSSRINNAYRQVPGRWTFWNHVEPVFPVRERLEFQDHQIYYTAGQGSSCRSGSFPLSISVRVCTHKNSDKDGIMRCLGIMQWPTIRRNASEQQPKDATGRFIPILKVSYTPLHKIVPQYIPY